MTNSKGSQKRKASLSALAANNENSDGMLPSSTMAFTAEGSYAKEASWGFASAATWYDLAKEASWGFAMLDAWMSSASIV